MYKEAKEVARQFEEDLKALLKKHKATIELEDLPTKHAYSVPEKTIKVYIDAVYKDGDCLAEFAEIDLGVYIHPD
tara:strand:+ start:731 stop:955 length:225 start_codon:yes stop_codon:yes gene_type:complete